MNETQSHGPHGARLNHHAHGAARDHADMAFAAEAPAITDPVCGMTVDPSTSKHRFESQGGTFHFCSARCRERFATDPNKYLPAVEPAPPPVVPAGTVWTCPMHPEIRQDHPGNCPLCGMALEPVTPTSEVGPNPELADMSSRFWIGLALTVPVFALVMADFIPGVHLAAVLPSRWSIWLQFLLATPVVLWSGWPFFVRGWQSVLRRHLNMFRACHQLSQTTLATS